MTPILPVTFSPALHNFGPATSYARKCLGLKRTLLAYSAFNPLQTSLSGFVYSSIKKYLYLSGERRAPSQTLEVNHWGPSYARGNPKASSQRAAPLGCWPVGFKSDWNPGQPDWNLPVCAEQHGTPSCPGLRGFEVRASAWVLEAWMSMCVPLCLA